MVDPGRYINLKDEFSAKINAFMAARVEIVTGVMLPPDLATFMAQAKQMGFAPTFVTVAKAALTPKGIASFPDALGENLSGEVYWEPQYPFRSSLTGETTTALAGAQWRADGTGGFRLVYTFNALMAEKWREGRVLLLDEPTRGVDVGARAELYGELDRMAAEGRALLMVSSDLRELMAMADRIGVMSAGRLVAVFERGEWSEQSLLAAAFSEPGGRTSTTPSTSSPVTA